MTQSRDSVGNVLEPRMFECALGRNARGGIECQHLHQEIDADRVEFRGDRVGIDGLPLGHLLAPRLELGDAGPNIISGSATNTEKVLVEK